MQGLDAPCKRTAALVFDTPPGALAGEGSSKMRAAGGATPIQSITPFKHVRFRNLLQFESCVKRIERNFTVHSALQAGPVRLERPVPSSAEQLPLYTLLGADSQTPRECNLEPHRTSQE